MLSKAKVQGAEPLALLMVGSMERGTYVCTYTLRCYKHLYIGRKNEWMILSRASNFNHLISPPHYSLPQNTGNKVFRYQSWEAQQLHAQLQSAQLSDSVPVAGLYSYGAFTRLQDSAIGRSGSLCALMYVRVQCCTYDIVFSDRRTFDTSI